MDKVLNNLGLCNRANGLVSGEEIVCDYIAKGIVKYVFLANDASDNAKKKIIVAVIKVEYNLFTVSDGFSFRFGINLEKIATVAL